MANALTTALLFRTLVMLASLPGAVFLVDPGHEHIAVAEANKLIEAQRIEQRTLFDLEMIQEMGFCHGIENYSRHLSGRRAGERPGCLLDYFPGEFLLTGFDLRFLPLFAFREVSRRRLLEELENLVRLEVLVLLDEVKAEQVVVDRAVDLYVVVTIVATRDR
jgi:hypothetical protein